jgi:hypothetical protein
MKEERESEKRYERTEHIRKGLQTIRSLEKGNVSFKVMFRSER